MDRLFFHYKSAAKPPGKGVHEHVSEPYPGLQTTWRSTLSNFWPAPFTYEGHRYNTVEHAFQAAKLYIPDRQIPYEESRAFKVFALDGKGTPSIAEEDGYAARRLRKLTVLSAAELAIWDATKEQVMFDAQFAKFSQNPMLREILLATRQAELWHGAPRQMMLRMTSLEKVRTMLSDTPV